MICWQLVLLVSLIQNGALVVSKPTKQFAANHHLTSPWLKPKATEKSLELRQSIDRVDEFLNRPNDYEIIMEESGEENDQLSRLLFRLQNMEMRRRRLILQGGIKRNYDQNLSQMEKLNRVKRRGKKSKERRGPNKCKTRSHERPRPRSHEKHGHRSREKHGPKGRGGKHGKHGGRRTREKHGPKKHRHRSREKHKHRSHEMCPPDDEAETTRPVITTLKPTTDTFLPSTFSTAPSTTTRITPLTKMPTTLTPRPTTLILTTASSSFTTSKMSVPPTQPVLGGSTMIIQLTTISTDDDDEEDTISDEEIDEHPTVTGDGDDDASISYEDLTFSPDAETLIPFL